MFSVVIVTLLYHRPVDVIPLLRGNSDALNQSHLRNFSAYIMTLVIFSVLNEIAVITNLIEKEQRN